MEVTVFAGFNEVDAKEIRRLKEMNATRVIIGLDNEDDDRRGLDRSDYDDEWELRPQLQNGKLEASIERLLNESIEVGAHHWMRPTVKWTEGAQAFQLDLARRYGGPRFTVMADIEKFAHKMNVKRAGFEAWDDVVSWWNALWSAPPCDGLHPSWPHFAVAVFPFPNYRSRPLAISSCVQEIMPMTYANKRHWAGEPVTMLNKSIRLWREDKRAHQILTMGMGAVGQARGKRSDYDVMMQSAEFVARQGVKSVGYWQLEALDHSTKAHAQKRQAVLNASMM